MFFHREEIVTSRAPLLPKAIAKAPDGEGCPKCGGYVYAAEQMLARGRVSIRKLNLNKKTMNKKIAWRQLDP